MSDGTLPQCKASIRVHGLDRRCLLDDDHSGCHRFDGGYKSFTVEWHEPRWQMMIFTGVRP